MNLKWLEENQGSFQGEVKFNEPLSSHTYYRIGGPASVLLAPRSETDLKWIWEALDHSKAPLFILGAGSNVLVSDQGFDGIVLKIKGFNRDIDQEDPGSAVRIRTGAGVAISSLLRKAIQRGWSGFEFLAGVPGTVGGAVYMNAGTHLGETQDVLSQIEVCDFSEKKFKNSLKTISGEQLLYSYRKNHFLNSQTLVLSATWNAQQSDSKLVNRAIQETLGRRKETQPIDYPSCGSVFKNPKQAPQFMHAWQVIDQLGLRGYRMGDAQFSEKHPNFILNHGKAKASEVYSLIELAKTRAKSELSILLEEEVRYVGF